MASLATQEYQTTPCVRSAPGGIQVLDIWPHIDPRFGGVGPAAAALAQEVQSRDGWQSNLLAVCDQNESGRHKDIPASVGVVVEESWRPLADLRLIAPLERAISKTDLCHIHGIWSPHALAAARIAKRLNKPVVSSAHGMLEKWDLSKGRAKKLVYSALFQKSSLAQASCLRALSEQESLDLRAYGLRNPIAIVPNGVNEFRRVAPDGLLKKLSVLVNKRVVLFLGRIHRKKGILSLLRAWPAVSGRHPDAHLLIAGSDYQGTVGVSMQLISDLGIAGSVTFCGVLNGEDKLQALSFASVFCLPSFSEGMSVAVLEALSIGTPVVITAACNIRGVAESGAGYITSTDVTAISTSLCECLQLSGTDWRDMSKAAQLLARSRYSWSQAGDSMRSVYEWLLGGHRPECVVNSIS